ncbi:MAG: hypothetical protein ACRC0G_05725 [Fusobacteriaceae bacterium]
MLKRTKFKFTEKGIIKKKSFTNFNHVCRTWEDVFENYGYDTDEKKKNCKKKFKKTIKQVEYTTGTSNRKYKAMVIATEYTGGKGSDLQRIAFSGEDIVVTSSNTLNKGVAAINKAKNIYKETMKELMKMLNLCYGDKVLDLKGDLVNTVTGEIITSKAAIYSAVNNYALNATEAQESFNNGLTVEDIAHTLFIEYKNKIEKIKTTIKYSKGFSEKIVFFGTHNEKTLNSKKNTISSKENRIKKEKENILKAIELVKDLNIALDLSAEINDDLIKEKIEMFSRTNVSESIFCIIKKIIKNDFKKIPSTEK